MSLTIREEVASLKEKVAGLERDVVGLEAIVNNLDHLQCRTRVRDQLPQYGDEDESPAIFSGQEEEKVRACKFSVLLSLEEKVLNN